MNNYISQQFKIEQLIGSIDKLRSDPEQDATCMRKLISKYKTSYELFKEYVGNYSKSLQLLSMDGSFKKEKADALYREFYGDDPILAEIPPKEFKETVLKLGRIEVGIAKYEKRLKAYEIELAEPSTISKIHQRSLNWMQRHRVAILVTFMFTVGIVATAICYNLEE